MCVRMPDDLGFPEGAAIACGTGTAYQALDRLALSGLDTLAVFGQGPVGLSATFFGSVMGARVVAIDPVPERCELCSTRQPRASRSSIGTSPACRHGGRKSAPGR